MTAWTPINPIDDIAIAKPITFEHGRAFYNNPIAIAEGADGAPRISHRAIQPGGAGIEGDFTDASVAPTAAGFYEYESIALTVAKTFPFISILRINGDVSIAEVLSIATTSDADRAKARWFNALVGENGEDGDPGGSGGGANIGSGGQADGSNVAEAGGVGISASGLSRIWLSKVPILGGRGGLTGANIGKGGGCLILIVAGDLDMTGGTLDASGADGAGSGTAAGGGAGGSVIVICTGTITNGTFKAAGGDGRDLGGVNGGGGGGGYVALIASDFIGVQTIDVSGGTGPDSAGDGTAGLSESETLTEAEINGILLR